MNTMISDETYYKKFCPACNQDKLCRKVIRNGRVQYRCDNCLSKANEVNKLIKKAKK